MAERERLTNKERRAQSRDERKRREAELARKRKRNTLRNGLITAAIVAVVGAVLLQAFLGGPDSIDDAITISSTDAEDARTAAGCEVLVDREPLEERSHFEGTNAPSADSIYTDVRPTHSGPHMQQFHQLVNSGSSNQLDERSTTHNLEHGAVIAWYDPDQTDAAGEMGEWSETLNANGFANSRGGAAVFVSPFTDPGISSGKAIAFRAWGVAMDCDEWNEDVANSFVIDHYGTHGVAPERPLGPYPEGVLEYEDVEVDDSDAPIDGQEPAEEPADTEGADTEGAHTEGEAESTEPAEDDESDEGDAEG